MIPDPHSNPPDGAGSEGLESSAAPGEAMPDGTLDREAQLRLADLKAELRNLLPKEHVHEYDNPIWTDESPQWRTNRFPFFRTSR